jgi:redox-sensitive bicupin YhaK (pirin superfamily)
MPEHDVIELLIEPRTRDLGDLTVRRALPDKRRQRVGPFIFFDHMGPAEFAPGTGINVRAHPHIGLATITYLFEGEILHRDSLGCVQPIRPGAVNWMTAGSGIVHSEKVTEQVRASGQRVHGLQTWVALPTDAEEVEPSFEQLCRRRDSRGQCRWRQRSRGSRRGLRLVVTGHDAERDPVRRGDPGARAVGGCAKR